MDGMARMLALSAQDRIDAQRQRDAEAFQALHRRPDALPDPIAVVDRATDGATFFSRLVARFRARSVAA